MDYNIDGKRSVFIKIDLDRFCQFTKNRSVWFNIFEFLEKSEKNKNLRKSNDKRENQAINKKTRSVYRLKLKILILNQKPIENRSINQEPNWFIIFIKNLDFKLKTGQKSVNKQKNQAINLNNRSVFNFPPNLNFIPKTS
jgi:hypothetical protein